MDNQEPLQYADFTRRQIHSQAWDPEVLELPLWNKLQDVTNKKYHNSVNFIVTQQIDSSNGTGWKEQKVWKKPPQNKK